MKTEDNPIPFWQRKTLADMDTQEWESLCDGCARCCLVKVQEHAKDAVYYTQLHCQYLDAEQCRCTGYARRTNLVDTCLQLTAENVAQLDWLPSTCAYRLIHEGKPLPNWHPLISGTTESIHDAGVSIRSFASSELDVAPEDYHQYVIDWLK